VGFSDGGLLDLHCMGKKGIGWLQQIEYSGTTSFCDLRISQRDQFS
jgi:hypothetical protein